MLITIQGATALATYLAKSSLETQNVDAVVIDVVSIKIAYK